MRRTSLKTLNKIAEDYLSARTDALAWFRVQKMLMENGYFVTDVDGSGIELERTGTTGGVYQTWKSWYTLDEIADLVGSLRGRK